jgi:hypothetical protein
VPPRMLVLGAVAVLAAACAADEPAVVTGVPAEETARDEAAVTADEAPVPDPSPETAEQIRPYAVLFPPRLPLSSGAGPSVLRIQIMLDRARFSPGVLDGRWGGNTEKAVYWFQRAQGLEATGAVDSATYARLVARAGEWPPVTLYVLTHSDVEQRFRRLPEDVYERAALDCLCYESLLEYLGERFHTTPEMLERLNPGLDFERLEPASMIWVPNVEFVHPDLPAEPRVARIVVSRQDFYTHALDEAGEILFHFPSTLGSAYYPSPRGDFRVVATTFEPWFHYQPELLYYANDEDDDAVLPPGPNSPVGLVWMALSKRHYGIHGTNRPETIGYASSAGCVRLTNWDAIRLGNHIEPGTPVEFR